MGKESGKGVTVADGDWNAAIEADLLPCPHDCKLHGPPAVSASWVGSAQEMQTEFDQYEFTVRCQCGAQGPTFIDNQRDGPGKAITAWNTRQPTTPTTGEDDVERAKELLAAEHEAAGRYLVAVDIRNGNIGGDGVRWFDSKITLRALEKAAALAAISPTTEDAEKRELVEALRALEAANDALCAKRSPAVYDLMDREARDELIELDEARRAARTILASIGERS